MNAATDVVDPNTGLTSASETSAAVMAMISDSNFITDGQISGCSGFEMEYMPKAAFSSLMCSCWPWYTAPDYLYKEKIECYVLI